MEYVVKARSDLLATTMQHHLETTRSMSGITVDGEYVHIPLAGPTVQWKINQITQVALYGNYCLPVEVAKASATFCKVWNPTGYPRQVVEI